MAATAEPMRTTIEGFLGALAIWDYDEARRHVTDRFRCIENGAVFAFGELIRMLDQKHGDAHRVYQVRPVFSLTARQRGLAFYCNRMEKITDTSIEKKIRVECAVLRRSHRTWRVDRLFSVLLSHRIVRDEIAVRRDTV